MKKIIILFITLICVTGCMPTKTNKPSTLSEKIDSVFVENIKDTDDIFELAQSIKDNIDVAYNLDISYVNPGYLPGFVQDITGFEEGVLIAPVVGTIPFVCYIFKTDNIEVLKSNLEKFADMRWNICTEADEQIINSKGNYVLFAMVPSFE